MGLGQADRKAGNSCPPAPYFLQDVVKENDDGKF
jgi:hypothetical protein